MLDAARATYHSLELETSRANTIDHITGRHNPRSKP